MVCEYADNTWIARCVDALPPIQTLQRHRFYQFAGTADFEAIVKHIHLN